MDRFIVRECGNSAEHALYRAIENAQAEKIISGNDLPIAYKEGSKLVMYAPSHHMNSIEQICDTYLKTVELHDNSIGCIDLGDGEFIFFGYLEQDKFIQPSAK